MIRNYNLFSRRPMILSKWSRIGKHWPNRKLKPLGETRGNLKNLWDLSLNIKGLKLELIHFLRRRYYIGQLCALWRINARKTWDQGGPLQILKLKLSSVRNAPSRITQWNCNFLSLLLLSFRQVTTRSNSWINRLMKEIEEVSSSQLEPSSTVLDACKSHKAT